MIDQDKGSFAASGTERYEPWRLWMWAVAFVSIDALLLLGNVVHLMRNDPDEPSTLFSAVEWNGDLDGSYIEIVGHAQLFAGAVMLLFVSVIRRSASYGAWAATLVVLIADDIFQIHERYGASLVARFDLPALIGLRPQDLGELIVWAVLGLVLGLFLVITYILAAPADRRHSRILFGCVCVLAVFAVVIDLLHIIVEPHVPHVVALGLTLTETGGELMVMTLIVLVIYRITLLSSQQVVSSARS